MQHNRTPNIGNATGFIFIAADISEFIVIAAVVSEFIVIAAVDISEFIAVVSSFAIKNSNFVISPCYNECSNNGQVMINLKSVQAGRTPQ